MSDFLYVSFPSSPPSNAFLTSDPDPVRTHMLRRMMVGPKFPERDSRSILGLSERIETAWGFLGGGKRDSILMMPRVPTESLNRLTKVQYSNPGMMFERGGLLTSRVSADPMLEAGVRLTYLASLSWTKIMAELADAAIKAVGADMPPSEYLGIGRIKENFRREPSLTYINTAIREGREGIDNLKSSGTLTPDQQKNLMLTWESVEGLFLIAKDLVELTPNGGRLSPQYTKTRTDMLDNILRFKEIDTYIELVARYIDALNFVGHAEYIPTMEAALRHLPILMKQIHSLPNRLSAKAGFDKRIKENVNSFEHEAETVVQPSFVEGQYQNVFRIPPNSFLFVFDNYGGYVTENRLVRGGNLGYVGVLDDPPICANYNWAGLNVIRFSSGTDKAISRKMETPLVELVLEASKTWYKKATMYESLEYMMKRFQADGIFPIDLQAKLYPANPMWWPKDQHRELPPTLADFLE